MVDRERSRFSASWQDGNADDSLEDVDFDGADAAIAWGRERSDVVLIRLGNRGDTYFSAGAKHVIDDEAESLPLWPPEAPPPQGWWDPATGHRDYVDLSGDFIVSEPEER
jgi:hypothetical protein